MMNIIPLDDMKFVEYDDIKFVGFDDVKFVEYNDVNFLRCNDMKFLRFAHNEVHRRHIVNQLRDFWRMDTCVCMYSAHSPHLRLLPFPTNIRKMLSPPTHRKTKHSHFHQPYKTAKRTQQKKSNQKSKQKTRTQKTKQNTKNQNTDKNLKTELQKIPSFTYINQQKETQTQTITNLKRPENRRSPPPTLPIVPDTMPTIHVASTQSEAVIPAPYVLA
jgi:hypothetical protein